MKPRKIVLAGGTGSLGQAIIGHLKEYEYVVLCRHPKTNTDNVRYVKWDGESLDKWAEEIDGSFAVINLAGRSIDCRYTEQNKKEILESRINSTAVIGKAIQQSANPPALWINASSATIYKNAIDRPVDEESIEFGEGFSVNVCKEWEGTFNAYQTPGTRKVILRISIVFGRDNGVIPIMKRLAKLGLGGKQGSGDQYISWIHESDFVNVVKWIIEHEELKGAYNCTAPEPVTNSRFMKLMREACHMPFGLPATNWMLEIGAWVMRTETELVLKSRRVVPTRLLQSGFQFKYPKIEEAIEDLMNNE